MQNHLVDEPICLLRPTSVVIAADYTILRLMVHSLPPVQEIEAVSGQSCGVEYTGGVNFACTEERWEYLRNEYAR
jgi:hypothetical protein